MCKSLFIKSNTKLSAVLRMNITMVLKMRIDRLFDLDHRRRTEQNLLACRSCCRCCYHDPMNVKAIDDAYRPAADLCNNRGLHTQIEIWIKINARISKSLHQKPMFCNVNVSLRSSITDKGVRVKLKMNSWESLLASTNIRSHKMIRLTYLSENKHRCKSSENE